VESDAFDRGHGTTAYCADLQQAGTHGFAVDVNLCARPALCPLSDLGNAIRLAALTTSSLWRQHG
jgi:hypothetical protein